jgi:hypothetical protein
VGLYEVSGASLRMVPRLGSGVERPRRVRSILSALRIVSDGRGGEPMKIEILYFDGCPTYRAAEETLRGVLAEEGTEAEVELVAVNTYEEAKRLRFPGSPTIRVDDRDLFPMAEHALGCRMYATPEGLLKGSPTAEMVRAVLAERNLVPRVS